MIFFANFCLKNLVRKSIFRFLLFLRCPVHDYIVLFANSLCLIRKTLLSFSSALENSIQFASFQFRMIFFITLPPVLYHILVCLKKKCSWLFISFSFTFSAFLNSSEHLCNCSSPNSQETSGRLGIVGRGCTQGQF